MRAETRRGAFTHEAVIGDNAMASGQPSAFLGEQADFESAL